MNIVIIAGEVSGELLGGKLATELYKDNRVKSLSGIGGDTMRAANVSTLHDVSETSVVGITEIVKHYPRLRKILNNLKQHIKKTQPDLLILIDYPEFNLKLAKYAKTLDIKVMFYVSPQVWAWRTGRVAKIKAYVDHMAVLFPFEVDFYKKANIPVSLVRHPLLEDVDKYYSSTNTNEAKPLTIGLAPGSRSNEIKQLFPLMTAVAVLLSKDYPGIRFLCPVAPGVAKDTLVIHEHGKITIDYVQKNFYESIDACDVVAISSGTATLQTALMAKPMVVIYKVSPVTYKLFGHLIKVKHISLPNIILRRRAYTELIQHEATVNKIYTAMKNIIETPELRNRARSDRNEIYNQLNAGINSHELAGVAIDLAGK